MYSINLISCCQSCGNHTAPTLPCKRDQFYQFCAKCLPLTAEHSHQAVCPGTRSLGNYPDLLKFVRDFLRRNLSETSISALPNKFGNKVLVIESQHDKKTGKSTPGVPTFHVRGDPTDGPLPVDVSGLSKPSLEDVVRQRMEEAVLKVGALFDDQYVLVLVGSDYQGRDLAKMHLLTVFKHENLFWRKNWQACCAYCHRVATTIIRTCPCHTQHTCNPECHKRFWSTHKQLCHVTKAQKGAKPMDYRKVSDHLETLGLRGGELVEIIADGGTIVKSTITAAEKLPSDLEARARRLHSHLGGGTATLPLVQAAVKTVALFLKKSHTRVAAQVFPVSLADLSVEQAKPLISVQIFNKQT